MTAISLGQAARLSRGSTANIAAIKGGRFSRGNSRYAVGSAELPAQFEPWVGTSRPQEFSSGFVDFLLGRGDASHP
jgi:hypothetical protein